MQARPRKSENRDVAPKGRFQRFEEEGAAIVEFVFALPVLLLFVCAVLDASVYIKAGITADTAATAAVRYLMDESSSTGVAQAQQELGSYLARVDAAFALQGASVKVDLGETSTSRYTHRFYMDDGEDAVLLERKNSAVVTQPVAVTVTYTGAFLTPLGRAASLSAGQGGKLVVTAVQNGDIDLTGGSTW